MRIESLFDPDILRHLNFLQIDVNAQEQQIWATYRTGKRKLRISYRLHSHRFRKRIDVAVENRFFLQDVYIDHLPYSRRITRFFQLLTNNSTQIYRMLMQDPDPLTLRYLRACRGLTIPFNASPGGTRRAA